MASGCPIIATAVSGHVEAITDGQNGLLVPSQEPASLAIAIIRLLEDEGLRRRLGSAARATVERDYAWIMVAQRTLAGYERALALGK
jgi:phosphatidylinositol alpha-mannosyltransferase